MSLESIEEHRDLVVGLEYEEYHDRMSYEDREWEDDDAEPGETTRPDSGSCTTAQRLPAPDVKEAA